MAALSAAIHWGTSATTRPAQFSVRRAMSWLHWNLSTVPLLGSGLPPLQHAKVSFLHCTWPATPQCCSGSRNKWKFGQFLCNTLCAVGAVLFQHTGLCSWGGEMSRMNVLALFLQGKTFPTLRWKQGIEMTQVWDSSQQASYSWL